MDAMIKKKIKKASFAIGTIQTVVKDSTIEKDRAEMEAWIKKHGVLKLSPDALFVSRGQQRTPA